MLALIGFYVLLVIYFFACLFLILVILAQEGKGGGLSGLGGASAIGETFGFGAASAALRKWTRNAAIIFIVLTIVLTFWGEMIVKSRVEKFLRGGDSTPVASTSEQTPKRPDGTGTTPGAPPSEGSQGAVPNTPAVPAAPTPSGQSSE
ncbi:MAG: preprotein translocase subunit SecG [Candidatus Sumerlaeaceae bacterium]|nr:preprotein translocase subunit SecG [Candidatus Sumerlaeaceae bacterium]